MRSAGRDWSGGWRASNGLGTLNSAAIDLTRQLSGFGRRTTSEHRSIRLHELIQEGVDLLLAIGGAFHSPLLVDQVEPYGDAARAALQARPRVPLVSCTTQEQLREPDDLVTALARALVLPVRWTATVDAGPGRTLVNLARHTPSLPADGLSPERARRAR